MELITVQKSVLNGVEVNSVNARELHKILEIKKAFSTWIQYSLDNAGAISGEDFIQLKSSLEGSGYQLEYIITTDMAKHIAMMSKVPKGKEVRDYFIECERRSQRVLTIPEQIALIAQGHQDQEQRIKVLEDTKRLENWQERSLHDAKNQKVYEIAKDDKELATKLHRKVWSLFKKQFNLPRFNELPSIKFNDGMSFIKNLSIADMV